MGITRSRIAAAISMAFFMVACSKQNAIDKPKFEQFARAGYKVLASHPGGQEFFQLLNNLEVETKLATANAGTAREKEMIATAMDSLYPLHIANVEKIAGNNEKADALWQEGKGKLAKACALYASN